MKNLLVALLLLTSFNVHAECSRQELQGEYASTWVGETGLFGPLTLFSTHLVARLTFGADGKISVANGTGTARGGSRKFTGGGSFNVSRNCSGTATITLRNSDDFRLKLQLHFIAAGDQPNTTIDAVYYNKEEGSEAGHMTLRRINL